MIDLKLSYFVFFAKFKKLTVFFTIYKDKKIITINLYNRARHLCGALHK